MTTKVLVGFSRSEIFKVTLTEHFRAAIGWAFANQESFETTEHSDAVADFKAAEFARRLEGQRPPMGRAEWAAAGLGGDPK